MRFQKTLIFSLILLNLAVTVISQMYPQLETRHTKRVIAIGVVKDIVKFDSFDNDLEKDPQNETTDVEQQLEDTVFS